MVDVRRIGLGVGSVVAGAVAGYAIERLAVRPRLRRPSPPAEAVEGAVRTVGGPVGVRLHVEVHEPEGPATEVVFVHGYTMGSGFWREQVAALRDRFRVVVFDLPGHGRSTSPEDGTYSFDLLADSVAAILREVTEPARGRLVLVGHSLGGMTLLALAERHPDLVRERVGAFLLASTASTAAGDNALAKYGLAALGLARGPAAKLAERLDERREDVRRYLTGIDLSHVITRAIAFGDDPDPAHVALTIRLFLETDPDATMALVPILLGLDQDEALRAIDLPTIVVVGSEDRLTPVSAARHIAEVNPDVELLELPGVGHMTPLETPAVVNALIVRLAADARGEADAPFGRAS